MIRQHPHGVHECYCVSCGYVMDVEENIKCNTISCPICGNSMRASETGEYRIESLADHVTTLVAGVLTGIGIGLGFLILRKLNVKWQ